MNFITYSQEGVGCYLVVGSFTDLETAKSACPAGGKVEVRTAEGSYTIFP